jgi:hypothetical protein
MGKLLSTINAWFDKQSLRDDMLFHCKHQPVGSCSEACAEQVRADRW